ncbi:MAG: DUF1802 family protein [Dehalococcoidia bacterium]
MSGQLPNPALKEWAAIWRAVVDGRQILDLRKGGIREEGHSFRVRATRFWLYDSYEHQRPELLRAGAEALAVPLGAARPPVDRLRFTAWAEVTGAASITEPAQLRALDGEFIWTHDYAAQRLRWRPKQPLWLLMLRAYRLEQPIEVPLRADYAGCASWVPMHDLPADPRLVAATPVLTDAGFTRRADAIRAALPGVEFCEDARQLVASG